MRTGWALRRLKIDGRVGIGRSFDVLRARRTKQHLKRPSFVLRLTWCASGAR
jgi:hypothetical protein